MKTNLGFSCILLAGLVLLSCGKRRSQRTRTVLDVSKPYKISYNTGRYGDRMDFLIRGKYSGTIKVGMTSYGDPLTKESFGIYKDSIDADLGGLTIYQTGTGFTWYIRPIGKPSGQIVVEMTEHTTRLW